MSAAAMEPGGGADLAAAVRAARGGDDAAFCVLYDAVQPGLLRHLRVLVGQDAEDVASETWLQIARDIRSYRGEGAGFRAWAASIARNRALDQIRCRSHRPVQTSLLDVLEDLAAGQDTAEQAVEAVSTEAAIALIATLPRDQAGLCRAYLAGAGGAHGKAIDSPAFTALVTAAGGRDRVDGYCTALLATPPGTATQPSGPPTSHPTGHPTGPPTSHPTGHPTGPPTGHPTGPPSTPPGR